MTEAEVIELARALPSVAVQTADEASGAPEMAWGDSFFYYDPDDAPEARMHPFATVVVKDYDGFDTASDLNRPGIFRLNVSVGRERFQALLGYPPAEHAARADGIDYTVLDEIIPHPVYATQGWLSVLCPRDERARPLLEDAHRRAVERYRPRDAER